MLELSATSLLGVTLLFALLIFIWWLIVDWSFGTSATATEDKSDKNADPQRTNSIALVSGGKTPDTATPALGQASHTDDDSKSFPSAASEHYTTRELTSSTIADEKTCDDSFVSPKIHHDTTTTPTASNRGSDSGKLAASTRPAVTSNQTTIQPADLTGNEGNSAPGGQSPKAHAKVQERPQLQDSQQPQGSQHQEPPQSKRTQAAQQKLENSKQVIADRRRIGTETRIKDEQGDADQALKIVSDLTVPGTSKNNKNQSLNKSDDSDSKYQTAAKAGRPSAGGEVSLQIPTDTLFKPTDSTSAAVGTDTKQRTSRSTNQPNKQSNNQPNNSVANKPVDHNSPNLSTSPNNKTAAESALGNNVHSIKVAASNSAVQRNKASTNSSTSAPVTDQELAKKATGHKQSPIEIVVAQKVSDKSTDNNQSNTTTKHDDSALQAATETIDSNKTGTCDNAALRARLAASERRILNLQSTINTLQSQPAMAAPAALSPQRHSRPTLLSKVRVLDNPRA